jgi:hypothetical protein
MAEMTEEELRLFEKFKMLKEVDISNDVSSVLQQKVDSLLTTSSIKAGDVVRWKKGLKNRKLPKENVCCVVIDVLENPIIQDTRDAGTPYYREPLDLVLAMLDDNSDLILLHYDQRRFEVVKKR